ncbi:MAG: hypothetical protein F4206_14860 [Gammaproteobacteria bacterium]|nr:hypothetical protein [Gammaproteobacteria bacterium]MYG67988.1 hypothetical protein [Gammaproteobacteria bacterium]
MLEIRPFRVTIVLVVLMAVLATGYSFIRHTTAHDWYAASKLAAAEILVGAGLDWRAPVRYRGRDGQVIVTTRLLFRLNTEAVRAKFRIVRTAAVAMETGAICGLFSSIFHLLLLRPGMGRREWEDEPVRDAMYRPDARDRYPPPEAVLDIEPEEPVSDGTGPPVSTVPPDPVSGVTHENTLPARSPTHSPRPKKPKPNWF